MQRILVIEDEHSLREDIIEILRFDNFEVHGAANGQEGIDKAHELSPDLIICDIMMPVQDGYSVLMELRSDPKTATIPFVFLTAKATRADMRRGMEIGADDYLTKPFTQPELLAAINTRLEKQHARAEEYERRLNELRLNIIHALPHELRTPITGILGYARMMMEDCEIINPAQIFQMSNGIDRAATRLHRLTENYLLYAQLALMETEPESIAALRETRITHPAGTIESTAIQHASDARRSGDLALNLQDAEIYFTEESLYKIILELVDNAVKFSDANTSIYVNSWVEDATYCITVRDEGVGMTLEEIESIGAYMQYKRRLYEQTGIGLGLVLVRKLVLLHNGTMQIESEPGRYTQVNLLLPRVP